MEDEKDACGVEEFARKHGVSRAFVYLLWQRGKGPRYMQVGGRRLVSKEAARDWRLAMEKSHDRLPPDGHHPPGGIGPAVKSATPPSLG